MIKRFLALACILPMLMFCKDPVDPDPKPNPDPDPEEEVIPEEIVDNSTILVTNEAVEDFITNVKYTWPLREP